MSTENQNKDYTMKNGSGFISTIWYSSFVQGLLFISGITLMSIFAFFILNMILHFTMHQHLIFENWYIISNIKGFLIKTANVTINRTEM